MKLLIVLLSSFVLSLLIIYLVQDQWYYILPGNIAMCLMLCFTSIGHFAFKDGMSMMIPAFIPFKKLLVLLSGFMEIALGILLLFPEYRAIAGWCLVVFLMLIYLRTYMRQESILILKKAINKAKGYVIYGSGFRFSYFLSAGYSCLVYGRSF